MGMIDKMHIGFTKSVEKPKPVDVDAYLHDVLNPEDITGLTKKFKVAVTETSDYYRRAEVNILAINSIKAEEYVYNHLFDFDEDIDWEPDAGAAELEIDNVVEVKV